MFASKLFSKALKQKRKRSNVTVINCKRSPLNETKTSPQKRNKPSLKLPKQFVS